MSAKARKHPTREVFRIFIFLIVGNLFVGVHVLGAQSLLDRAKKAVQKTSIGKQVDATALEVEMLDASYIDLENSGLGQVRVGQLSFGLSGLDIADGKGIRLQAYLYNPTSQDATIPAPGPDLFRLVDSRGRTLELLSGPKIEDGGGSGQITIPGLERIHLSILFGGTPDTPGTAILKIGNLGVIENIPVHTGSAAEISSGGANSVWSGNQPAQPASPWQAQQPPPPPTPNYTPPPPSPAYPTPGQTNQPPAINQPVPTPGGLAGINGIQFRLSGAITAQSADSGTVQCTSTGDGRFVVSSSGLQWTIEANAQARDLGSYPANIRTASLQQSAEGAGTLILSKIDNGLGGVSILRGSIAAQGLASATGPVSLAADYVCQL